MNEEILLNKIVELTKENERLKIKLEQYESKKECKYTREEMRDMLYNSDKNNEDDKKEDIGGSTENKFRNKKLRKDLFKR